MSTRVGRPFGITDKVLDGLSHRVMSLSERHDQPLTLVGWSFGGLLCRWLAHEHSDKVRHVVTMGAPWRAEGERTRVTGLFKSAAGFRGDGPSGGGARDAAKTAAGTHDSHLLAQRWDLAQAQLRR